MERIKHILERLHQAREGLEAECRTVPAELWRHSLRPGAWSAGEVIAHLTMVEQAITDGAAKLIAAPPRPIPFAKRLHLPVVLAAWRGFKAKTPIPLDSKLVAGREEMLANFAALRGKTVAFLEENAARDLSSYRWRHPFFGQLNFYQWFKLLAYHEERHTKQIREIIKSFRK